METTFFYTRKGDDGATSRLGGTGRLSKSSRLMEAVGVLDETTCALGLARVWGQAAETRAALPSIQRSLSRMMAHLSATPDLRERYPGVEAADVAWLEEQIAALEAGLPPLRDFVLPGESAGGAAYHLARVAARRAEREWVAFTELEPGLRAPNLAYLNRLSAFLFVAALREDQLASSLAKTEPQLY